MDYYDLLEMVKHRGKKITDQRELILQVLFEHKDSFFTVKDILNMVSKKKQGINMSTIYRNLEMLYEVGIIHKIIKKDQKLYCVEINGDDHVRKICKNGEGIEGAFKCPLEDLCTFVDHKSYDVLEHNIELFGICTLCHNLSRTLDKENEIHYN